MIPELKMTLRAVGHLYRWRRFVPVGVCGLLGPDTVSPPWPCAHLTSKLLICSVWSFYIPLFGTLVTLGLLYWKRHSHPLNLVLLSAFTLLEAFTLGIVMSFYENVIILQAL